MESEKYLFLRSRKRYLCKLRKDIDNMKLFTERNKKAIIEALDAEIKIINNSMGY